jgi:rhodanese-related sulfurtransferase
MTKSLKLIAVASLMALATTTWAGKQEGPKTIPGATTIDVSEARKLFDAEIPFIDVRKGKDWDAGRIPGAYHLDVKKALTKESLADVVKPDETVVFYCNGPKCLRSSKATAMAVSWGYKDVKYFRDGFPGWKAAGNPVE